MPGSYDVAIIGAGPVGDTLALLLGQHGICTLLADKSPRIYPLPRAAHIDHEIVRVFQQLGVADRVMAASRTTEQYDFLTADRQVLMRFETRGSPSGWPAANMIHQPSVEEILRDRMSDFPAIDLHTGWEMTQFERDGVGVDRRVRDAGGSEARAVALSCRLRRGIVEGPGSDRRGRWKISISMNPGSSSTRWFTIRHDFPPSICRFARQNVRQPAY